MNSYERLANICEALRKGEFSKGVELAFLSRDPSAAICMIVQRYVREPADVDILVSALEKEKEKTKKESPICVKDYDVVRAIVSKDLMVLCPYMDFAEYAIFGDIRHYSIKHAILEGKQVFVKYFLERYVEGLLLWIKNYFQLAFKCGKIDVIECVCDVIERKGESEWTNSCLMGKYAVRGDVVACRGLLDEIGEAEICYECMHCLECESKCECEGMLEWLRIPFNYLAIRIGIEGSILRRDSKLIEMFAPYFHCFGAYNMENMMDKIFGMGRFELSKALIDGVQRSGVWKHMDFCSYICKLYDMIELNVLVYLLKAVGLELKQMFWSRGHMCMCGNGCFDALYKMSVISGCVEIIEILIGFLNNWYVKMGVELAAVNGKINVLKWMAAQEFEIDWNEVGVVASDISVLKLAVKFGARNWKKLFEIHGVLGVRDRFERIARIEVVMNLPDIDFEYAIREIEKKRDEEDSIGEIEKKRDEEDSIGEVKDEDDSIGEEWKYEKDERERREAEKIRKEMDTVFVIEHLKRLRMQRERDKKVCDLMQACTEGFDECVEILVSMAPDDTDWDKLGKVAYTSKALAAVWPKVISCGDVFLEQTNAKSFRNWEDMREKIEVMMMGGRGRIGQDVVLARMNVCECERDRIVCIILGGMIEV